MRNQKTFYEWDIETVTADSDVEDHNHSDKCPGIPAESGLVLVLVRDVYEWPVNDPKRKCAPDLKDRQWAYVENGRLPSHFDGGAIVPKSFMAELAKSERA